MIGLKYAAVARNEARSALAYRGSLSALLLSAAVLVGLQFFVWHGIYDGSSSQQGLTLSEVLVYTVTARLWATVLPGFRLVKDFEVRARDGSIVRDLLYPASFLGVWFARAVGRSAVWLLLVVIPLLALALVLIRPDLEAGSVLAAMLCGVFGYLIAFSLAGLVGISTLFLRRSDGLNELRDAMTGVLGAAIVPLTFYPETVAHVLDVLPFVYVYYVPISLFSGLGGTSAADVVVGGVWAAALLAALTVATTASRSRLVTDGG